MCSTNHGFSVGYVLCTTYVCTWYQPAEITSCEKHSTVVYTRAPDGRGPEVPARPPLRTTSDARGTVKRKSRTKCAGVECWDEVRTVFGGIERGSLYSSTAAQRYRQPTDHGLLSRLYFFAHLFEPVPIRAGRRKSLPPSILRNFRFFFRFSDR